MTEGVFAEIFNGPLVGGGWKSSITRIPGGLIFECLSPEGWGCEVALGVEPNGMRIDVARWANDNGENLESEAALLKKTARGISAEDEASGNRMVIGPRLSWFETAREIPKGEGGAAPLRENA